MQPATQLRSDIALVTDQAQSDLDIVFRDIERPEESEAALRDTLPALIVAYGAAAATVAANWYDDLRDARGVRGRFTAIPAEIPEVGAQALVGWALTEAQDLPGFRSLVAGGTQRRIVNFSRFTVTGSSEQDPGSKGWVRVGAGECDWCKKYLDGEIRTVAYDFPAHDHCNCHAEPAFL